MNRIVFTDAGHSQGRMIWDGGECSGPIPPLSGEFRPIYDRLIAQGVNPEPFEAPADRVPAAISDRQFAHGLWKHGVISLGEAKAFVTVGEIPAALAALIGRMPNEAREEVELLVCGSTSFERHHPFTVQLAAAFGWSDARTDAFWRFAATL